MFLGLRTIVYPAPDLADAIAWWTKILGIEPYFNQPYYVGFNPGGYELGLDPDGDPATGPVTYWGVPDADVAYAELLHAGAEPRDPVAEVGAGIRLGTVTDPVGNIVGVVENPVFRAQVIEAGGAGPGK